MAKVLVLNASPRQGGTVEILPRRVAGGRAPVKKLGRLS